mgnify:CR=1 FL=1
MIPLAGIECNSLGGANLFERIKLEAARRFAGIEARLKWSIPDRIGSFWFQLATLEVEDRKWTGFGAGKSLRIAAVKACAEAVEMQSLSDSGQNLQSRSGSAASLGLKEAKIKALEELIERDAFLFHWLTEQPGGLVDAKIVRPLLASLGWSENCHLVELRSKCVEIKVAFAATPSLRDGCWHLGLGSASTIFAAAEKALTECRASIYFHDIIGGCRPMDFGPKANLGANVLKEHHALTKDKKFAGLIHRIASAPTALDRRLRELKRLDDLMLEAEFNELASISHRLTVVHAKNRSLLPLVFGATFDSWSSSVSEYADVGANLNKNRLFHPPDGYLRHPFD